MSTKMLTNHFLPSPRFMIFKQIKIEKGHGLNFIELSFKNIKTGRRMFKNNKNVAVARLFIISAAQKIQKNKYKNSLARSLHFFKEENIRITNCQF